MGKCFSKIVPGLKWFFFSFIWLGVLLFILDLVTKTIVKSNMQVGDEIVLIPNFLAIHYVQNSGMAFGMDLADDLANTIFWIVVSIVGAGILIGITIYAWKKLKGVSKAALMIMIAGTLGNLIDRAFYTNGTRHFVVDWIGFFGPTGFPRFNIADASLTVGTVMLVVYLIVIEFIEDNKKKKGLITSSTPENTEESKKEDGKKDNE